MVASSARRAAVDVSPGVRLRRHLAVDVVEAQAEVSVNRFMPPLILDKDAEVVAASFRSTAWCAG